MTRFNNTMIFFKLKDHSMIETRRLKNVVIFIQTILSFVLSRQTKIPLSKKHIPNFCFQQTIMQCANLATFLYVPHGFLFQKKIQDQTFKNSKQIYSPLPKFFSKISYRSIAYQKNKVTSSQRQSRALYCENHF